MSIYRLAHFAAAGLNLLINTEVDALKEQRKAEGKDSKLKNIKTAVFGIGGSNRKTVGSSSTSDATPYCSGSPTLDPNTPCFSVYFIKALITKFQMPISIERCIKN